MKLDARRRRGVATEKQWDLSVRESCYIGNAKEIPVSSDQGEAKDFRSGRDEAIRRVRVRQFHRFAQVSNFPSQRSLFKESC